MNSSDNNISANDNSTDQSQYNLLSAPDIKFIRSVKKFGGDTLKKCYQCATCSGICPLSSDDKPFPRKEMIMTQLGMKKELLGDPDIWYCHNCNDCSKYCPRGARPGDVMGALRAEFISENAIPKFLGHLIANANYIATAAALIIPLILLFVILTISGHLNIPDGKIIYSRLFSTETIDLFFSSLVIISLILYVTALRRFWLSLMRANKVSYAKSFGSSFGEAITEFLLHKNFSKCEVNKDRKFGHMMVFYGFIGLFITTCWVAFYYWVMNINTPISLDDPMKWFANLSAFLLIVGIIILIGNRLKDKGINTKNSSFDWSFTIIILLLALTGLSTEAARLASLREIAYPMYLVHLTFVFYIIVYFPYSKLSHMGYRILAITYYKMIGKDAA